MLNTPSHTGPCVSPLPASEVMLNSVRRDFARAVLSCCNRRDTILPPPTGCIASYAKRQFCIDDPVELQEAGATFRHNLTCDIEFTQGGGGG
jgi:hypothetical protein